MDITKENYLKLLEIKKEYEKVLLKYFKNLSITDENLDKFEEKYPFDDFFDLFYFCKKELFYKSKDLAFYKYGLDDVNEFGINYCLEKGPFAFSTCIEKVLEKIKNSDIICSIRKDINLNDFERRINHGNKIYS